MEETSPKNGRLKIAAIADLHMQESLVGAFRGLFLEINKKADILIICGDLTDHGYPKEAELLVQELRVCSIPVLGVLGNHDFTNNQQEEIKNIITSNSFILLGEKPYVLNNVGFAGVKGFCGGFNNHMLGIFGEKVMKDFVYEAVNESLKLEEILNRLETEKKVVILHYAPIVETVFGENPEVYSFMGSSRLVNPIETFDVNVVFHGHVHRGSPEGKTIKGIPVYNVSFSVRKKVNEKEPYLIYEI